VPQHPSVHDIHCSYLPLHIARLLLLLLDCRSSCTGRRHARAQWFIAAADNDFILLALSSMGHLYRAGMLARMSLSTWTTMSLVVARCLQMQVSIMPGCQRQLESLDMTPAAAPFVQAPRMCSDVTATCLSSTGAPARVLSYFIHGRHQVCWPSHLATVPPFLLLILAGRSAPMGTCWCASVLDVGYAPVKACQWPMHCCVPWLPGYSPAAWQLLWRSGSAPATCRGSRGRGRSSKARSPALLAAAGLTRASS
jgi:hypothetical protein